MKADDEKADARYEVEADAEKADGRVHVDGHKRITNDFKDFLF